MPACPNDRPLLLRREWKRSLLAAGLALGLASCAPMPPAVPLAAQQPQARVETARGETSAARSKQIIERLKADPGTPSPILDRHLAIESALTGQPLVTDNEVTLLQDGDATYRAMFAAIESARHHVNMETYILQADEAGQRFADALIAKRREGVVVNLLVDSVGTLETPAEFFDRLRAAGVSVLEYNPINPLQAPAGWDPNQRDHRKLLIVDGRVAVMGGINISAEYSSGSIPRSREEAARRRAKNKEPQRPWRDTDLRIEGPVVAEFQQIFLNTWGEQNGPPISGGDYTPPPPRQPVGRHVVRAIPSTPRDTQSAIYNTLMSSIAHAEEEIFITMAYFVPDVQLLDALCTAARRGVDVELILPRHTDVALVQSAGRSHYGTLLRCGVKLYERREVLLHAKTAVIDGVWSTVGSANLDWRSFVHNQELNAVVLGSGFGDQMRNAFARDRAASEQVSLQAWENRPLGDRLHEWLGRLLAYWL
ncbi:phospholipase D-like domain-containing protein [Ideonella sp. YS5]